MSHLRLAHDAVISGLEAAALPAGSVIVLIMGCSFEFVVKIADEANDFSPLYDDGSVDPVEILSPDADAQALLVYRALCPGQLVPAGRVSPDASSLER